MRHAETFGPMNLQKDVYRSTNKRQINLLTFVCTFLHIRRNKQLLIDTRIRAPAHKEIMASTSIHQTPPPLAYQIGGNESRWDRTVPNPFWHPKSLKRYFPDSVQGRMEPSRTNISEVIGFKVLGLPPVASCVTQKSPKLWTYREMHADLQTNVGNCTYICL